MEVMAVAFLFKIQNEAKPCVIDVRDEPDITIYTPIRDEGTKTKGSLYVMPKALADLDRHLHWGRLDVEDNRTEQGGILVGKVFKNLQGVLWGMVEAFVAAESAKSDAFSLAMTPDVWFSMYMKFDEMNADRTAKLDIIGWYHTHPNNLPVFMSATDLKTQSNFFSDDWKFSLVLNPHTRKWRAFRGFPCIECDCVFLCDSSIGKNFKEGKPEFSKVFSGLSERIPSLHGKIRSFLNDKNKASDDSRSTGNLSMLASGDAALKNEPLSGQNSPQNAHRPSYNLNTKRSVSPAFQLRDIDEVEKNPFDRQERIAWWRQDLLRKARIMVVGAGAIGNETLKNLSLLGFGNIFVCDFDVISVSNLSRTVLFRRDDAGKRKAETAAERVKEMALERDCKIDFFDGDIVWELGSGVYRYFDVVLGCLDNVETRFAVNRRCSLLSIPWIDAGINELGCSVSLFNPPKTGCYHCFASKKEWSAARQRYSCDNFKKRMFEEGKMPTVQISAAIVSALQVQETAKLICGQEVAYGKKLYFQGATNLFDVAILAKDENCFVHYASIEAIREAPFSSGDSVGDFLTYLSRDDQMGYGATIDLNSDRSFLKSAVCSKCGKLLEFYRPSFSIYNDEFVCEACKDLQDAPALYNDFVFVNEFSLSSSENRILNMSLKEIGIPALHIVAVRNDKGKFGYYELTQDKKIVLPNIMANIT
jgi:adenylyltransferase/sulfurtransferase